MYQTVGHQAIQYYADAMRLPLFRGYIRGACKNLTMDYEPTANDEVEDLYQLLKTMKETVAFEAVCVGAILSEYQTKRVLNVCERLSIKVSCWW